MISILRRLYRVAKSVFALCGLFATGIAGMLAWPLQRPPEFTSLIADVRAVDYSDLPDTQTFQARDGVFLAYRAYQPADPATGPIAILLHGSSGSSINIHAAGRALSAAGVRALAPDIRGHGRSGARGDIARIGQLDDDLADFVAHQRLTSPATPLVLAGHSAGGALALRTALGANANLFDRYVLLAPYVAPDAPVSTSAGQASAWVSPNIARIFAISILRQLGLDCCEGMPVLAFGLPPNSERLATPLYSYRLMANFITDPLAPLKPADVRRPLEIISGDADELMDHTRYERAIRGTEARVTILPGVNHMGVVAAPHALAAIIEAVKR